MDIEKGWRFNTADFSCLAAGRNKKGYVQLIRDPENTKRWHKLPDEIIESNECPELHVYGYGFSFEEAVVNANFNASLSRPIG